MSAYKCCGEYDEHANDCILLKLRRLEKENKRLQLKIKKLQGKLDKTTIAKANRESREALAKAKASGPGMLSKVSAKKINKLIS